MKKAIFISALILISHFLTAQEVQLTVEAPSVVALGEQFRISWTANSRAGNFVAPEMDDFYVLSGPQTSFSQSTQIINGKVQSSVSNTYTYYLQANKAGKYTIGPGVYTLNKDEFLSDPVSIEVVEGQHEVTEREVGRTGKAPQDENVGASDLYVRLLLNKREIYMGEPLVASLKIYSRVNLSGIQEVEYPDFKSFLKEDLETPQLRSLERENVNGTIYGTGVLQQFLLYPQRSGTIEIEPANMTVLIQQRSRSNDPFFGDFFSSFTNAPKKLATLPVEVNVKPLPPGAPVEFNGAVGNFDLNSSISADTVTVNDAVTYRIVLRGQGNLMLAGAPELKLSPDIEIYEPKVSSDLNTTSSGTSGSRIFEYVLIPRYHGNFTIPSTEYSYFDPSTGKYRTLRTKEYNVYVNKGDDDETGATVFGGVSKENVRFLGKDIRFISTGKPKFRRSGKILIRNNAFLYSYLGMLLAFLVIIIIRREQIKRNSDIVRVRNRKAAKVASRRLKKSADCLNESDVDGFYSELIKAIWGYLSDKFNIPLSELSIETVEKILSKRKVKKELIEDLIAVIERCEYARYSPDSNITTADETYNKAEMVIKSIEK